MHSHVNRRGFRWLVVVAHMLVFVAPSHAEDAAGPEPAISPTIPRTTVTADDVQTRLRDLEAAAELDASQKAPLVDVYRKILARLEAAESNAEKAEAYRRSVETAPEETAAIQRALSDGEKTTSSLEEEPPPDMEADDLQQRIAETKAHLSQLKSRLTELENLIQQEQARPGEARARLTESRAALDKVRAALAAPSPAPEATELEKAQRWLLEARFEERSSEVQMLEQELLSHSVRLELLTATRDLTSRQVSTAESRLQQLEKLLSRRRQEEAERASREAAMLQREAIGKHRLVQELAEEISEIAREAEPIAQRIDQAQTRRARLEERLQQLKTYHEEAGRIIDLGLSESLGAILLELRRDLPSEKSFRREATERTRRITESRLRLFQIDRELKALSDLSVPINQRLTPAVLAELDEDDRRELRLELERLLVTKRENLQRLAKSYRAYLSAAGSEESREQEVIAQAEKLDDLLDRNLLWIRNAQTVGADTLRGVVGDSSWAVSPAHWREVASTLQRDATKNYSLYGLLGIFLIVLFGLRRRLNARIERIAQLVGKIRQDRISLTLQAAMIHVLRCLPGPALAGFIAWRLLSTSEAADFTKSVGSGLQAVALTVFCIHLVMDLCRPNGVGRAHFQWSEKTCHLVRVHLLWFLLVAIPLGFLVALTQGQPDPLYRHNLGRVAFILLMLAVAVLLGMLLHPSRGLPVMARESGIGSWLWKRRGVWRLVLLVVPLVLVSLASAGYYYTALEIESRLNQTVVLIIAAIFVHDWLHRWVVISQRRLALKVAIERRQAQLKSQEAGEDDASQEGLLDMLEEIDVGEIGEQIRGLLRVSVGVALLVGLGIAWAGVFPALRVFEDVHLWYHTVVTEGGEELRPITLANLSLALLFGLLTVVAARNMPGFLEISLLQRLPLDPGTRYATRTLVLYVIVSVGVVITFQMIGVGWSSVQWLVAALTVGLGFGLQEIFANFVSGLIILLERPIRVGDTVTVDSTSGVVTRIRMRATTITDWNRRELIVPNKSFITGHLINWSLSDQTLRMDFLVGIAYGSDTTLAHKVLLQVCSEHPLVLNQPEPNVFFVGFGDNSLNFEVRVFVSETTNTGRTRVVHDLHMAIDRACREHGITIAFPQRDLHLKTADTVLRVARVDIDRERGQVDMRTVGGEEVEPEEQ